MGKDTVGVRVDRKRRQHITAFLRALYVVDPEKWGKYKIETKEDAIDLFGDYPSIQNTIERDSDSSSEEALIDLYRKLRPGEPATVESARNLVKQMFYTPKRYDFVHRKWYFDPEEDLNSVRHADYSRLDIMILRRFNFKHINLTTFLDLQNVFNRDNEWERVYLDDGTYEMSYQYKQMPVGGIIIEF